MHLPMIFILLVLAVSHNCPASSENYIPILFPDSGERVDPKPDQDASDDVVFGVRSSVPLWSRQNNGHRDPLSVNIFHPHLGHKVYSGRFVEFKCRANGSKPPFQFTWWKGDNQITTSSVRNDNINRPRIGSIRFKPEPSDDGLILRCQVHSDKDGGEDSRELTVLSTCRHMFCSSVNEECEDSDGTTAGTCRCKSGYIRDSSNNCVATCRHMSCLSVNEECEDSDGTTAGFCQCESGYIRDSSNSCVATCRQITCSTVNEECEDSDGTTAGTCQCKSGYIRNSSNSCVATCRHMSCSSVNEECEDSDGTRAGSCQCKSGYIRDSSNNCVATCRHVSCSSVNEECEDSDGTTAGTCQCESGYVRDSSINCVVSLCPLDFERQEDGHCVYINSDNTLSMEDARNACAEIGAKLLMLGNEYICEEPIPSSTTHPMTSHPLLSNTADSEQDEVATVPENGQLKGIQGRAIEIGTNSSGMNILPRNAELYFVSVLPSVIWYYVFYLL